MNSRLIPTFYSNSLNFIIPSFLKKCGFKLLILDKDNTIALPFQKVIYPILTNQIKLLQKEFGFDNVLVLSNSLRSNKVILISHVFNFN